MLQRVNHLMINLKQLIQPIFSRQHYQIQPIPPLNSSRLLKTAVAMVSTPKTTIEVYNNHL